MVFELDEQRPQWHAEAACAGKPLRWWFADRGDVAGGACYHTAKQVCATCPVRVECLGWALEHRPLHGVWGGLTVRERQRLRARRRATAAVAAVGPVAGSRVSLPA